MLDHHYTFLYVHKYIHIPCVLVSAAFGGGRAVVPALGVACADGAEDAGTLVVAVWGDRVGYLRTLEPAARPAFDAEFPICADQDRGVGRAWLLRCTASLMLDNG